MSNDDAQGAKVKNIPDHLEKELELQGIASGTYVFRPLSSLRKVIARRTLESTNKAPHFALVAKIQIDNVLATRGSLNSKSSGRISVNDFIIKASALSLVQQPKLNATFTSQGIVTHRDADISFAVAMDDGLVAPIVRQAQAKSLPEIAAQTRDLAERGRAKRLLPDEYNGGTFSVSNLGMYGVSSFGAIINQPQSAILSVGAPEKAYVFEDDTAKVATILTATLTCDHRVIDGATGAKWLQQFKSFMETPNLISPELE